MTHPYSLLQQSGRTGNRTESISSCSWHDHQANDTRRCNFLLNTCLSLSSVIAHCQYSSFSTANIISLCRDMRRDINISYLLYRREDGIRALSVVCQSDWTEKKLILLLLLIFQLSTIYMYVNTFYIHVFILKKPTFFCHDIQGLGGTIILFLCFLVICFHL